MNMFRGQTSDPQPTAGGPVFVYVDAAGTQHPAIPATLGAATAGAIGVRGMGMPQQVNPELGMPPSTLPIGIAPYPPPSACCSCAWAWILFIVVLALLIALAIAWWVKSHKDHHPRAQGAYGGVHRGCHGNVAPIKGGAPTSATTATTTTTFLRPTRPFQGFSTALPVGV